MLVQVWPLVHRNDVFPIRRVLVQNFDMGHSPHSALIIGKSKFMSESTCLDLKCQAISPDIQSDTLQVKSSILVKQVGGAVSPFVFMNQVKVLVRMHLNSRTFILS